LLVFSPNSNLHLLSSFHSPSSFLSLSVSICFFYFLVSHLFTVDPAYNDIGLRDNSPIALDILWYELINLINIFAAKLCATLQL
jgi:hypothetical protein